MGERGVQLVAGWAAGVGGVAMGTRHRGEGAWGWAPGVGVGVCNFRGGGIWGGSEGVEA